MYKNRYELAAKIDWEGGLAEMLLSYGLSRESLPQDDKELLEVFSRLEPVTEMFEMLMDEFAALLPDEYEMEEYSDEEESEEEDD